LKLATMLIQEELIQEELASQDCGVLMKHPFSALNHFPR